MTTLTLVTMETRKHKKSKFILETTKTGFELVVGKWPPKGSLWKGEFTDGTKCELFHDEDGDSVGYIGWSS